MSERAGVGDLFREEFADVLRFSARFAARLPRPTIGRTSVRWAILAGVGAGFFATAVVRLSASLLLSAPRTTELQPPTGSELATIFATALALAVGWRAGGWLGVAGVLGIQALEHLLALPGLLRTCADPSFTSVPTLAARCSVGGELVALWPAAIGCALAVGAVRILVRSRATSNGALEAAGALTLLQGVLLPLANLVLVTEPAARTNPDPATIAAFTVGDATIVGIAAGVVLAKRSRWPWRGFAAISLAMLIGYLWFSVPSLIRALGAPELGGLGVGGLITFGAPLYTLAAAAISLKTTRATAT